MSDNNIKGTVEEHPHRMMVDFESLGTGVRSAVFCVAMACFDGMTGEILESKTYRISLDGQREAGRTTSKDTLEFWVLENFALFAALMGDDTVDEIPLSSVPDVIEAFALETMAVDLDKVEFWCKGTSFDAAILRDIIDCLGGKPFWNYLNEIDLRTPLRKLRDLHGKESFEFAREGEKHDPISDVALQCRQAAAVISYLERPRVAMLEDTPDLSDFSDSDSIGVIKS